jgi:hypothetical protein
LAVDGSPSAASFYDRVLPDLDVEKLGELARVRTRAAKALKILVGAPALVHVDAPRLEEIRGERKVEATLGAPSRLDDTAATLHVGLSSFWIDR